MNTSTNTQSNRLNVYTIDSPGLSLSKAGGFGLAVNFENQQEFSLTA